MGLKSRIEDIIYDDGKTGFFSIKFPILLLSYLFGLVVTMRRWLFEKGIKKSFRSKVQVISVGNITAGGTGKTPFTIYLADLLKRKGMKPAVITRGYGGGFEKEGGVVHDGKEIKATVEQAGDEPFLIAQKLLNVAVYAGSNRIKSSELAVKGGADILILDDGFQHLKIKRDIEIILLDSEKPFGNGHLIPRGSLRDPLEYLDKGDFFILTRSGELDKRDYIKSKVSGEIFRTNHTAGVCDITGNTLSDDFSKLRVFAFSGIAHNEKFRQSVKDKGFKISGFKNFDDHHSYTKDDISAIQKHEKENDFLITTEKDFVKIKDLSEWKNLLVVAIEIEFIDGGFEEKLYEKLNLF